MSVTSHLKDLLIKMGGTPKNGDSTSVLIDKIEDVYNGSGSGGGSGGSSSNLVVTLYADTAEDIAGTTDGVEVHFKLDKTLRQIMDAYNSGTIITLIFDNMKKFDLTIINDEGFDKDHINTWFCPRVNNSDHLNSLGYANDSERGHISIVSSEFMNQHGGGSTFVCVFEQYTLLKFLCMKETADASYNCGFSTAYESIDFLNLFVCDDLDDYPIYIRQFNNKTT